MTGLNPSPIQIISCVILGHQEVAPVSSLIKVRVRSPSPKPSIFAYREEFLWAVVATTKEYHSGSVGYYETEEEARQAAEEIKQAANIPEDLD